MTAVAIRLPDELVKAVDDLVAQGSFSTRTDAIRTALVALLRADAEASIDRTIVEAYTHTPQSDEEIAIATAATRALIEEEPW